MNDHVDLFKKTIMAGLICNYTQAVNFAYKNNLDFGPGVDVHTILRQFVDEGLIFIEPQGSLIYSRSKPSDEIG